MEATIYLQPSDNSLKIAKFVKNNIDNIKRAGMRVRMEKVPKDTSAYAFKKLEERGINRLPALVSGEVTRVGYDSIVDWFTAMKPAAPPQTRARQPESTIESFMGRALNMGDEDDEVDIGGDMARKAAQMAKMRQESKPTRAAQRAPPQGDENVRRVQPAEDFTAQENEDMINAYMQQEMVG
jgi:hypothetical protein